MSELAGLISRPTQLRRFGVALGCLCLLLMIVGPNFSPRTQAEEEKAKDKQPILTEGKTVLKPMVTGMKNPESVAIGPDGRIYITIIGGDKDGDGSVAVVEDGKAVPFAEGMDDPKGLVTWRDWMFVADKTRVWRVDRKGKAEVYVDAKAFPIKPLFLNDIEADEAGNVYVSDSGDLKGGAGAVFKIAPDRNVTQLVSPKSDMGVKTPNGLRLDSESHLFLLDFGSGELLRIRLADGATTKVPNADGFDGGDGITRDKFGRLFLTSWKTGKVWVIPRPGAKPILLAEGFQSAADCCLSADGKSILVPDMKAGTLTAVPAIVPGQPIDESPLPVKTAVAFPNLKWTGWAGEGETGKVIPHRPLLLTHAGDESNRIFVGTQHGVVHVFPNDQAAEKTKIFLDIQDRVFYDDKQNEEGFLGLTFGPTYKKTGDFYVYYTPKKTKPKLENVLSRFKVSKDDPDKADPESEEVLMRFPKPFWNHDGGTICFGPDGYLYIAIGDGGSGNDPFNNAQNLATPLGKVLRIDVSKKGGKTPYAIPADNPFTDVARARPEIWAYGLRNIWRMSFDRKTGKLWAADVGQNLWEEIDIIERGGNYGWNLREGLHTFGPGGVGPRRDLIEPIWEYHHDIGKSITGGNVYRGSRVPALEGLYLYGDYVSGVIWGLKYDEKAKRVTANHILRPSGFPIYSFGEDEKGEVYFMTSTTSGKGIYWFVPEKDKAAAGR